MRHTYTHTCLYTFGTLGVSLLQYEDQSVSRCRVLSVAKGVGGMKVEIGATTLLYYWLIAEQ
jgi:hypothetical protein